MTIEEKITRYREIPKRIAELYIDKEICTSVKSVQFDSIGAAHGSAENRTEQKLLRAAEIDEEIEQLEQMRAAGAVAGICRSAEEAVGLVKEEKDAVK